MQDQVTPRRRMLRSLAGAALVAGGGAAVVGLGGCASTSAVTAPELPAAVAGERREIVGAAGRLSYYVAGSGPPVLLIHSINATASAYEVAPIFADLARDHRVFAPDLPGFGFAQRSPRRYTPRLYVDAVWDMLDAIAADRGPGPIDALALSLSAEFLARAAMLRPERFRSLALVTPTGFDRRSAERRGTPESTRELPWLYNALEVPPWRQGLFDLLVSRRSIRYFLERTFGGKEIDEGLVDYAWRSAQQPGARHAPYAFVSGGLFSGDMRTVYESLTLPVWVPHGTKGDFRDFSGAGWAMARANWTFTPFPTGALPQFELPDAFNAAYRAFLRDAAATAQPASPSEPRSPSP